MGLCMLVECGEAWYLGTDSLISAYRTTCLDSGDLALTLVSTTWGIHSPLSYYHTTALLGTHLQSPSKLCSPQPQRDRFALQPL